MGSGKNANRRKEIRREREKLGMRNGGKIQKRRKELTKEFRDRKRENTKEEERIG